MNSTFMNETAIAVKVAFEHEIRRVSFTGNTFSALRDIIATLFSLDKETIVIKYTDDAGDLITMSLDSEVQEAIKLTLDSKHKILRLVVKGTINPFPVKPVNVQPETTPVPSANQKEESTCAEKKQQWRAKHEAFCKEMQETRAALLAAKDAGNFQVVNELRAKLHGMREQRIKEREQRCNARMAQQNSSSPITPTPAPTHVIARGPVIIPEMLQARMARRQEKIATLEALFAAKKAGNVQEIEKLREKLQELRQKCEMNKNFHALRLQRQAKWGPFHELRASLLEAKERGDLQAVKELREKLQVLRKNHPKANHQCGLQVRFRGAPCVPASTTAPAPACAQGPRRNACQVTNPERKALCEAFRNERNKIREALMNAKATGNVEAAKEIHSKLRELRERHWANIGRRPESTPTPAPAPAPAPATTTATTPAPSGKEGCEKRKEMWEAIRKERQELQAKLLAAKQSGDTQALTEAQANLKEFRDRVGQTKQALPLPLLLHPRFHHHHRIVALPVTPASPATPAPALAPSAIAASPATPALAPFPGFRPFKLGHRAHAIRKHHHVYL